MIDLVEVNSVIVYLEKINYKMNILTKFLSNYTIYKHNPRNCLLTNLFALRTQIVE